MVFAAATSVAPRVAGNGAKTAKISHLRLHRMSELCLKSCHLAIKASQMGLNLTSTANEPLRSIKRIPKHGDIRATSAIAGDLENPAGLMSGGSTFDRGKQSGTCADDSGDRNGHVESDETKSPSQPRHQPIIPHGICDATGNPNAPQKLSPEVFWFDGLGVATAIAQSIKSYYRAPYTCWSDVPEHVKIIWWNTFREQYSWASKHADLVKKAFIKKGKVRLKDIVSKVSKKKPTDVIPWLSPDVHQQLLHRRKTDERFLKRSRQAKLNKVTGPNAGTRHIQWSISAPQIANKLGSSTFDRGRQSGTCADDSGDWNGHVDSDETQPRSQPHHQPIIPHGICDATGNPNAPQKLAPEGLWFHELRVARAVTQSIKSYYRAPYTCWSEVPDHVKMIWWNTFREQYRWTSKHADLVKKAFIKKGKIHLIDIVCKVSMKKPTDVIPWLSPDVHRQLLHRRKTDEGFLKRSRQAKLNKVTGPKAGTRHIQGSISASQIANQLGGSTFDGGRQSGSGEQNGHVDSDETQSPSQPLYQPIIPHGICDETGNPSAPQKLSPEGLWFDDNRVARAVTQSIKNYYRAPYTCWSEVPECVKIIWWNTFREQYRWTPKHADLVRKAFIKKGKVRLKDMAWKVSKKKPTDVIPWLSPYVHQQLLHRRKTDEGFLKRSRQARLNQLAESKAGTRHIPGLISASQIADKLPLLGSTKTELNCTKDELLQQRTLMEELQQKMLDQQRKMEEQQRKMEEQQRQMEEQQRRMEEQQQMIDAQSKMLEDQQQALLGMRSQMALRSVRLVIHKVAWPSIRELRDS